MAQPKIEEQGFESTPDETGTADGVWRMQFVVSHKVFTTWSRVKTEKSLDDTQVAALLIQCYEQQVQVCPTCCSPLTLLCSKCFIVKQKNQQTPLCLCSCDDKERIVSKQQIPASDLEAEINESCSETTDEASKPQQMVKNKAARLEHLAKVVDSTDNTAKCGYNEADDIQGMPFYSQCLSLQVGRPSYLAALNDAKEKDGVTDSSCKQRLKLKRGRPRKQVKTTDTETTQDTAIAHTEIKCFPSYVVTSNDAKEKDSVVDSSCKQRLKLKRGRPKKLVKTGDTETPQDISIAHTEGKGFPSCLGHSNDAKDMLAVVDSSCKQHLKLKRGRPRKLIKIGDAVSPQDTSIAHTEGKGYPSCLRHSNDAKDKDAVVDSSCKQCLKLKRGRPRKLVKVSDTVTPQDTPIVMSVEKGFQIIGQDKSRASTKDHNRKTMMLKEREAHSLECNICGMCFKYQGALNTHTQKHTQSDILAKGWTYSLNPPRCNICCKNFNHRGLLVHHMKKHKQIVSCIVDNSDVDGSLECSVCGRKFIYRGALEKHMRKLHQHLLSSNDDIDSTFLLGDTPDKDGLSEIESDSIKDGTVLEKRSDSINDGTVLKKRIDSVYSNTVLEQRSDSIKDGAVLEQEHVKCPSTNNNRPDDDHYLNDDDDDKNLSSAFSGDDSEATFQGVSLSNSGKVHGYTCGVCGRWFLRLAFLANHAMRHDQSARNPFCCSKCQKSFFTMLEFTGHLCELSASTDHPQKIEVPDLFEQTSVVPEEGPEQLCHVPLPHTEAQEQSQSVDLKRDHLNQDNMDSQTHQSLQTSVSESQNAVQDPTDDIEARSDSLGNKPALELDPVHSAESEPPTTDSKWRRPKLKKTIPKEWELKELDRHFKCSKCPAAYRFASGLKKHFQKHTGISAYPCPQCDKAFSSSMSRQKHQENTHWGAGSITCQECGKQFKTQKALDIHLPLHSEKPSFQCNVCQKWFKTEPLLSYHFRKFHKIHANFRCGHCDKVFPTKFSYDYHLTSHSEFRALLCSHCGEAFPTKQHLTRHAVKHGPKQWVCEHCGKGFYEKSSYTKHKATHVKVRPYPCPESSCSLRFLKPHLRDQHHARVHLHLRPHKCTDCGACYPSGYRLKEHIRSKHTFERPYKCPLCPKRFAKTDCRKQHQRSHKVDRIFIVQEKKEISSSPSSDNELTNA